MPWFLLLILTCLILSLFIREKQPFTFLLPVFFATLLFIESLCYYFKVINKNNILIYNFWFPVEFAIYSFWVVSYLGNQGYKKIVIYCILFYLVTVGYIYMRASNLHKFNTISFQLGVILLIPVLLLKLYEFINESAITHPFKNALFWLISGLLISYLGSFFQFSVENYLQENHKDLLETLKFFNILLTESLYCCIIVYFILS
ncbi:MAG: hypothetical protein ABIN89_00810 [Chitinophagaceae bacterium]